MYEHFKGEEVFVKKILDYQDQVLYKQRRILTNFLNPYHCSIVKSIIGNSKEIQVIEFGGYQEAESKKIILAPSFYEIVEADFQIGVLEISYSRNFETLKHKDVLGAFMNLGIKRELFGDIIEQEDKFYVVLDQKILPYVQDNVRQIKKSKVKIRLYQGALQPHHQYKKKTFIVSSLRLDKIISAFYRIPRLKAEQQIRMGSIKVNHKIVVKTSFLCNNKDIISFKKHGRVLFIDCNRKTRQDNYVVEGWFYK